MAKIGFNFYDKTLVSLQRKYMEYIKSPFNWVGNKYKHLDIINDMVEDYEYDSLIDVFMGTGNLLFNIDIDAKHHIGNDKQELIPKVYTAISKIDSPFSYKEAEAVINENNRFSKKQDYYSFRDYWNKRYFDGEYDRKFCVETGLLLKMCSNSMVRFNSKGYFNQGFRGLGSKEEFFAESLRNLVVDRLNDVYFRIADNNYVFSCIDFRNILEKYKDSDRCFLVLDPPYVFENEMGGMYDKDYTNAEDEWLFNYLRSTHHHYIYFNYLRRGKSKNERLLKFALDTGDSVVEIYNTASAGQGRKVLSREVEEVIVTNV